MPNGVPMTWMATLYEHPPIVVDRGQRRDVHRRRRERLPRLQPRRHEHVRRLRRRGACARGRGERVAARIAVPAARPRTRVAVARELGAGASGCRRGSSRSRRRRRTPRRSGWPAPSPGATTVADVRRQVPRPRRRAARRARGRRASRPRACGVPRDATRHVRIVPYNDLDAVERELAARRRGVRDGRGGDHQRRRDPCRPTASTPGLRRLAADAGALLVLDETHTLVAGPGGLTARWGLEPDVLVVGKSISGGIPLGAYGMTAPRSPPCSSGAVGRLGRGGRDRRHAVRQRALAGRGPRDARARC